MNTAATEALTLDELDALKGASVQIKHDCTDLGTENLHMWAGKHGTLVGTTPLGGVTIAIGKREKIFDRDQFVVTAPSGAAPAEAPQEAATEAQADAGVRLVTVSPLQAINSTTNPRRRRGLDVDSLRTLADSILAHGLGNPILVRPLPASRLEETSGMDPRPAYEVIAGERRWRAAQLADLAEMPMFVRHMDDQAMLEMQLVENIEREDLDPMEEAEGFQLLREKLGYTVEQIADKMGKGRGPSYVRKRMKLLDLTPEAREAMYDGTLQLSTGLLVARYPAAKQLAAIKHVASMSTKAPDGSLVPAPFREVSLALYRKFATILKTAAFDITDPGLIFNAGPCTLCSKRTRANEDLFAESTDAGEDSCLDSACWEEKKTAHVQRIHADAKARGLEVIDDDDAKKVAPSPWSSVRAGYVSLDSTAYTETGDDGKERVVTFADALRAQGRKAAKPVVLINPHNSKAEELLPESAAEKLLPKQVLEQRAAESAVFQERLAANRPNAVPPELQAIRNELVRRAVLMRAFDVIASRERTIEDLRLIAYGVWECDPETTEQWLGWSEELDGIEFLDLPAKRRVKIDALNATQLATAITMASLEYEVSSNLGGPHSHSTRAVDAVKAYGIDILAVRDKVDEDLQRQQAKPEDEATDDDQVNAGGEEGGEE